MRHVLTIIAVRDLSAAVRFYADGLGWEPAVITPVYVEFRLDGGMRFGLYERGGFGKNIGREPAVIPAGAVAPAELYFHVDDLDAAIARLVAAGARELSPRALRGWGDEAAYYADPDGTVLVLARPS